MLNSSISKKIAVTGGIASGKSTVCRLFEKLGAYVVSADEIVHRLLIPTTILGKEIIALFGSDIVVDGRIDRKRIAEKAFRNPELLQKLEKRIHPEVQKVIEADYLFASQNQFTLFVVEIPLLFEAQLEGFYDFVVVVVCDEEKCKKRFLNGPEEYLLRSQRLMPIDEKIKNADFVIDNNGTLDELRQTTQNTFNRLL